MESVIGIITALVTLITSVATLIKTVSQARINARNAAKESILQLINEDYIADLRGELPTNYQNVLHEYDLYHAHGGNSYITLKVEQYKKWFLEINNKERS